MGATRLRPTETESHVDALTADQLSRLRVIAKACTPQTSRTNRQNASCPWFLRTATTRGAQQYVRPHGTSALRKHLGFQTNSSIRCQHARSNMYVRIFAGPGFPNTTVVFLNTTVVRTPCLLNTSVVRSGCKHDNSGCVWVR